MFGCWLRVHTLFLRARMSLTPRSGARPAWQLDGILYQSTASDNFRLPSESGGLEPADSYGLEAPVWVVEVHLGRLLWEICEAKFAQELARPDTNWSAL